MLAQYLVVDGKAKPKMRFLLVANYPGVKLVRDLHLFVGGSGESEKEFPGQTRENDRALPTRGISHGQIISASSAAAESFATVRYDATVYRFGHTIRRETCFAGRVSFCSAPFCLAPSRPAASRVWLPWWLC